MKHGFCWIRVGRFVLMAPILFVSLVAFLAIDANRASGSNCSGVLQAVIERHMFHVYRGLDQYLTMFGDPFANKLKSMSTKDHWIDLGCGEACAIGNYYHGNAMVPAIDPRTTEDLTVLNAKAAADKAAVTGVSFKSSAKQFEPRMRVIKDKFFWQIRAEELGGADLLTDLYGILSYTNTLDRDFRKCLKILKPNGELYLFLGQMREFELSTVTLVDGKKISLIEWFEKRVKGVEVKTIESTRIPTSTFQDVGDDAQLAQFYNPKETSLVFRRKPGEEFSVPDLKLVGTEDISPNWPVKIRHFIELPK